MPEKPRADVVAAFKSCRLWRTAESEAVERLTAHASVEDLPRGAVLASEGDPADRIGLLVVGKARVFHLGADGKRVILETPESGDVIAAVASLAGGRHPAYIDAATPVTVAWVPREALFELMGSEPGVARAVIGDLARRLMDLTEVIQTLALDVPARLARYLFQRALATGTATPEGLLVDLGMPKGELAAALGTVPETLSRAFARLRDEGVLEVRPSAVLVHDVGALARLGAAYEGD